MSVQGKDSEAYRKLLQKNSTLVQQVKSAWITLGAKEAKAVQRQKGMVRLKSHIKQTKEALKSKMIDIDLVRRQENCLRQEKHNLQIMEIQEQTLRKASLFRDEKVDPNIYAVGESTIQQMTRVLREQNKLLWIKIRDKEKQVMKEHQKSYARKDAGLDSQDQKLRDSVKREIDTLHTSSQEAQAELRRQMQSVDANMNRLKTFVDQKRKVYQQRLNQVTVLRGKVEQKQRIRNSIEKQKQRQREQHEKQQQRQRKRNSQSPDQRSRSREGTGTDTDTGTGIGTGTGTGTMAAQKNLLGLMNQITLRNSTESRKPPKTLMSIAIGTTFYYNQDDYK